jgi:hypothetical protein
MLRIRNGRLVGGLPKLDSGKLKNVNQIGNVNDFTATELSPPTMTLPASRRFKPERILTQDANAARSRIALETRRRHGWVVRSKPLLSPPHVVLKSYLHTLYGISYRLRQWWIGQFWKTGWPSISRPLRSPK